MTYDRATIETILDRGKKILLSRPELADMSLSDIIDELYDGTQEMTRDRWGVAAWVIVKSISNFEMQEIIDQLSGIESYTLICEYVGYLLMTECRINLEELLLYAEKCSKFDKIIPFVSENLIYEAEVYEHNVVPILDIMENHFEHNSYRAFLHNYAKHIEIFKAQGLIAEQITTINRQVQYDLMHHLWDGWYGCDVEEAGKAVDWLLGAGNIWSKKAAIDCLSSSIYYDRTVFQNHFEQIKSMIKESDELWIMIIPLFTKYIMAINNVHKNESDCICDQVLKYLERIPNESLDVKYSFLESVQYQNGITENLQTIVHSIWSRSFCKDQRILNVLDSYLYIELRKSGWREILRIMKEVFLANQYSYDYEDFFRAMHLARNELRKHILPITLQAISDMLSGDLGRLFFGLGLLANFGDILALFQDKDNDCEETQVPILTNPQMIQLMKAVLYYWVDSKKVCNVAFQIFGFSIYSNELYVEFCMTEIFGNYPATMYETAKQYINMKQNAYVHLAELVISTYERQLSNKQLSYQINDLRPSQEHDHIYRKAIMEQNRRINKQAAKESVVGQLFKTRTLKYGVRSAYIMTGRKDEKTFQIHPYARIECRMELPRQYICDPVGYELKRLTYIKEVTSHASDC